MKICRECRQEKNRTLRSGRPFFYCHCVEWKRILELLERARSKPHRKED